MSLDQIIERGNRTFDPARMRDPQPPNKIRCADGFTLSVIAGEGAYSSPRPDRYGGLGDAPGDYPGPYHAVEVGFPSSRPEPWDRWVEYAETPQDPTQTVYGYVPVPLVRDLVASHGGEA